MGALRCAVYVVMVVLQEKGLLWEPSYTPLETMVRASLHVWWRNTSSGGHVVDKEAGILLCTTPRYS